MPTNYVLWLLSLRPIFGSNRRNINIPTVTAMAMIIFLYPSFNYLCVTLEQNMPTRITFNRLHDLVIIISG